MKTNYNQFLISAPAGGIYLCLIGHGFCYVPALSYINIRSSNTTSRKLRLSLPHILYLFGVALGATITVNNLESFRGIVNLDRINRAIGTSIIVSTVIILVGYIINDLCQYYTTGYNYKCCLDPSLQRENESGEIFHQKIYNVIGRENMYANINWSPDDIDQINNSKEMTAIIFSIFSRGLSAIYFYYPFVYLTYHVSVTLSSALTFYFIHWIALFGVICGSLLLMSYSTKNLFIAACSMIIISLIINTILTSMWFPMVSLMVLMWIGYFVIGFGHSYADIVTFEIVSLKNNEIAMTIGYVAQMITIGTVLHGVIVNFNAWFCFRCGAYVHIILRHSLSFIFLCVMLIIIAIIIMPKIRTQTLLEVKNIVLISMMKLFRQDSENDNNYALNNATALQQQQSVTLPRVEAIQNYGVPPSYYEIEQPPPYEPPANVVLENEKSKI